jgi:hypothetical protein
MKNSGCSIFINKTFDYQFPNGPKVTMEFQIIAYPNNDSKSWGYDVEPVDTTEIEVMGIKLSERPETEGFGYNKKPKQVSAITAYEQQMDKMGVDIGAVVTEAFEAEIKQFTRLSQLLEGTGIMVEADINNEPVVKEEASANR